MKFGNMFYKVITIILALAFVCSSALVLAAENDVVIKLQIDNPVMRVNDAETEIDPGRGTVPVIIGGRTLVPIRAIIEALGGIVGWDGEKSEVSLEVGRDEINLVIDSKTAYLNGNKKILDVAPTTINDRTMLPIRFVAESFNFKVEWDEATNTVTVIKRASQYGDEDILEMPEEIESIGENENEETVDSKQNGGRLIDDGLGNLRYETVEIEDNEEENYEDEYYGDEYYGDEYYE